MARKRSKKFYVFTGLAIVIVGLTLLVTFSTGPVSRPLQTMDDVYLAAAAEMPGVTCNDETIEVKLTDDAWFAHDVVGTLCWTGATPNGKTLAVTVSGAGYGALYWTSRK